MMTPRTLAEAKIDRYVTVRQWYRDGSASTRDVSLARAEAAIYIENAESRSFPVQALRRWFDLLASQPL
jgi:hypothetical protein